MNNLGRTLSALIDENWGSQRAFARECGIDQATIHHIIGGRPCSRENLRLFCEHISSKPEERYAVLIAHLEDEAAASGLDSQQLVLRTIDEVTLSELQIDGPLKRHLALIGDEASRFKDVREMVQSLAGMISASRERAGNVYPFPKDTAAHPGKVAEDPAVKKPLFARRARPAQPLAVDLPPVPKPPATG